MKTSVSIRDVAKKAGVSISTVSRSLNKSGYVKKELEEKISNIAKELNYKPNVIAKGLRTKRTNTIAVIIPDLINPYYSEIVEAIEKFANDKGFDILITCTFFNDKHERQQIENLKNKLVSGFIIIHGYYNYNFLDNLILDGNTHIITVDRVVEKISSISIDYVEAVKKEIDYLFENGHKKIAYITIDQKIKDPAVHDKIEGYLKGLSSNNISYKSKYLYTISDSELDQVDRAYKFILNNTKILQDVTAIVCGSDYLAIGVIRALKELRIQVPEKISVMGFDNITLSKYIEPSLTTLENPKKEKGLQAIKLLFELIESSNGKKIDSKVLETEIIVRESTLRI